MFQIMRGNRRVKRQKLYFDISLHTIVAIVKLYGSVYTYNYLTQSIGHFRQYRVLKKSCRKIIANFFKNMGASDFLSLLGASHMWSIW